MSPLKRATKEPRSKGWVFRWGRKNGHRRVLACGGDVQEFIWEIAPPINILGYCEDKKSAHTDLLDQK